MITSHASLAVLLLVGFSGPASVFEISSSSVADGKLDQKFLAKEFGGQNISPALSWKDPPSGTKSFVLTLFDHDALDGFGWWHWQVLKIPATATGLPEGAGTKGSKVIPSRHPMKSGAWCWTIFVITSHALRRFATLSTRFGAFPSE